MADKVKLYERKHPLYEDNEANWFLYASAAAGGVNFTQDEANLFSHRLEDSEDYEDRKVRSYFLNFCDTIPDLYNKYIFKEAVERGPDTDLELFRNNIDGKRTTISNFVKRSGYFSSIYGVIHALVATPAIPKKGVVTKADEASGLIYPRVRLIHPTDFVDWSLDANGNFRWAVVKYTYYRDLDPLARREEETHYKIFTLDKWWIEDDGGDPVKFEDGSPNSGPNNLGVIPIVTMYHKEVDDNKIGQSLLKDIVFINRAILNWCSCIDEQIDRQTFSQLVVPDDGSLSEDEAGEDPLYKIGTSSVWTYNSEAKNPPQFISPNTETINTIWSIILDHIKEIFRMSGLQGGTSDLYTSRSGRQSQMSFVGVNSSLAEKAGIYQQFENNLSRMAYTVLGKDPKQFEDVKYPSNFDVAALEDEIDTILKICERNFSTVLNKELEKKIARKALPHSTAAVLKSIESEIDASDGHVDPLKAATTPGDVGNPNSNAGDSFTKAADQKAIDSSHRNPDNKGSKNG